MATSGTTSFVPITDDMITEAWERCGKSASILNGEIGRSARRSLQLMLIDWSNKDLPLWQIDRQDSTLAVGVSTYEVPAGTADVVEVWLRDPTEPGTYDLMLWAAGRDEYAGLSDKLQRGRPSQYWVERRRDLPVLHFWPVPDKPYIISVNRFRLPQDIGGLGMSADVPVLWSEALAAGLAARLAVKFAPDRVPLLKAEAAEAFSAANGEDRERVPLSVLPDIMGSRW